MTDDFFVYRGNTMKKNINLIIGIFISAVFLILYNLSVFAYGCENIRDNTIRLHIIASSDSDADQNIKFIVRDKLLEKSAEIFNENITTENAVQIITPKLEEIKIFTDNILEENNIKYVSQVKLETEYFDTRIYDNNIIMPAGKYLALKIILGDGQGKNWWCVMFPSLCIPVAEKAYENIYSENEIKIINSDKEYKIRFKIIEYIELFKNKVDIDFKR